MRPYKHDEAYSNFSHFCERAEREERWWSYCEFYKFCIPELYVLCDTSCTACCECNSHLVLNECFLHRPFCRGSVLTIGRKICVFVKTLISGHG